MITSISNSHLTAQIKHGGAELCSLKNNLNSEFIWEGNPEFWGKHSPILFPIVGTLKENSYSVNGKKYQMSRHGFARDMEFELIEKQNNSARFSLKSNDKTLKMYPFEFELQIDYQLINSKLNITYKVINNSENEMPFAIGGHPAFAIHGNFEDYRLEFKNEEVLDYFLLEDGFISSTSNKLFLNNNQLHLNYQLFKNDALVFKKIKSKSITILKNKIPFLKVNLKNFPNLGIWTVENAPFLCIEPWFGYSDTLVDYDDLSKKEAIQLLNVGMDFESDFQIEIL